MCEVGKVGRAAGLCGRSGKDIPSQRRQQVKLLLLPAEVYLGATQSRRLGEGRGGEADRGTEGVGGSGWVKGVLH